MDFKMANLMRVTLCAVLLVLCTVAASPGQAQTPSQVSAPPTIRANPAAESFDVYAAVQFYLAKMPPSQRARSNAYFEGGYWLLLFDFVVLVLSMWTLLRFRLSVRMRDWAEGITRFRWLQAILYWVQFLVVVTVFTFPMTVYEGYFREHKYGLLNQTFGPWFREQAIGFAVSLVLGAVLIVPLFALVRRLGKN
jgi:STE24 endopeptidase